MSLPRIYLYPSASGPLRMIEFDRGISRIDVVPNPQSEDVYTGDQQPVRAFHGMRYNVFIGVEKFIGGDQSFERNIHRIEAHLAAGGVIGFSYDHAKTWASMLTGLPAVSAVGSTPIVHHAGGNAFAAWNTSAALTVNDEVVLEGDYQSNYGKEETRLDAWQSHQSTLEDPVWYDYPTVPLLRYRWFFPVLYQPQGASTALVTTDYRLTYNFGLQLEYSPSAAMALFGAGGYGTSQVGGRAALPLRSGVVAGTGLDGTFSLEQRLGSSFGKYTGRT